MGCAAALRVALGNALSWHTALYMDFKATSPSFEHIFPVCPSAQAVHFSHQKRMEGWAGELLASAGPATGSVL